MSQKWYNVLSFRCMRRDESSDESTVISSQTSTLTRNRGKIFSTSYLYFEVGILLGSFGSVVKLIGGHFFLLNNCAKL